MCGSTSAQNDIFNAQQQFYSTLTSEAKQVFGQDSQLFADLTSAFEPILAAGPNQQGFSAAENTALNTQATEGVAKNYAAASKAVSEKIAAEGGGDEFVPSGQNAQIQGEIATAAANTESTEQNQITEVNYAMGRQNFEEAARGIAGAGGVYNSATGVAGVANQGGENAANTANQIAQANNSIWDAAIGAVGGIAGSYVGTL